MYTHKHEYIYIHIYSRFTCVYIWRQFHPEVDLTENGRTMIKNFLQGISAIPPNFTPDSRHQVRNFFNCQFNPSI